MSYYYTNLKFYLFALLSLLFVISSHGQSSSNRIRILTLNLQGAVEQKDFTPRTIAGYIKATRADFVALQEVDFKTARTRHRDLVTELGFRTGMLAVFGKAKNFDSGARGVAILSKYPIIKSRTINLPHLSNSEPKIALEITTRIPSGDTLRFVSTCLDYQKRDTDRINQITAINKIYGLDRKNTILAGSLNAHPESKPIKIMKRFWKTSSKRYLPTYPFINPKYKADYILYRPKSKWQVVFTKVIKGVSVSSHCGYLVSLEIDYVGKYKSISNDPYELYPPL